MRFDCHDASSLLERLARRERETVFLVGSAVSIPSVPGVGGMLDLIRGLHPEGAGSRQRLDDEIAVALPAGERRYVITGIRYQR